MTEELRKTGIDVLGDVPWGTHFCQFYHAAEDLVEVLVPYFKAGLGNNEFCMWICSEPLAAKDAEEALRAAVPDLDGYLEKGQIEILAHDEWYVQDGAFDSQRVLDGWVEKLNAALAAGFDGLRLTGNTHWLESDDWADFAAYEQQVNSVIGRYRMLAVCSYPLDRCGAAEILDVASNHQFALIRRGGKWQRFEDPERRRAAESLRLHDEIAANMSEGVYLVRTSDAVIAYANPRFEEMFGYEHGEMIGKHVSIVNAPTDRSPEETAREIMGFIAANGYWRGEVNSIKKDGAPFWCHASVSVLDHHEYGNVLVAVHTDITERKRAEDAQRLHSEITANMPGGVHLVRAADGVIVYTNPKFEEIFGYGPGELVGKHISIVNAPTDKSPEQIAREIMDAMAKNGSWRGEILNIRKNGTTFWSYASVSMFDHPEHGRVFVAVHTDITERKRVEQKFEEESQMRMALLDGIPGCIAMILKKGTREIVASNRFAREVGAVPGQTCFKTCTMRDDSCPFCLAPKLWKTGQPQRLEVEYRGTWYEAIWVSLSEGLYVHYIFDISERKRLEAQYLQAQKMEAVGQLAGGVAHDFRNQLAVIKGYGEMLLRRSLVAEEGQDKVDEILKAANRSAKFTDQLLAFSRKELLRPKVMSLCGLVENMTETLKKMIGEDIELSVLPGIHGLFALLDPGMFHQAILNLVTNARDAMPDGGSLTIGIKPCEVDAAAAARHPDVHPGRYVMVAVTDTGAGMDEKTRARVFEPFFSTKEVGQGTGLGLSMVHGFVNQSGGFVEADSEPGKGTTFRLHFPAVGAVVESAPPEPDREEIAGGTETILVAEDEEPLRRLMTVCLRESGYTILKAKDYQAAMQHVESEDPIDMLVTDVVMPGTNGVELAKRFRRLRPGAPVLYVSGYGAKDLSRRGIEHDGADVLTKPFSHDDLLTAVRVALDAEKRTLTGA